jgi:hypothetical protein
MAKSSYDNIAKPVRKRSAKTGTLVGVRLQSEQLRAVDDWAAKQRPPVTRPEAIRGILELGLTIKTTSKRPSSKHAVRAKELARNAIDNMSDANAPREEQEQRRRQLTKGPLEFREGRVDQPKAKPK